MARSRKCVRGAAPGRRTAAVPVLLGLLLSGCASLRGTPCPPLPAPQAAADPWTSARTAAKGAPEAIGSPSAGCLRGAASITPDGTGFRVMRTSRRRYYGHPRLIATLRDVAAAMDAGREGTLLVGDLSMARGGPMTDAHGSHQTGLDADVWFSVAEDFDGGRPFTLDDRENLEAARIPAGTPDRARTAMIRRFASHPAVERLFVAPPVKRELCRAYPGEGDAAWLRKVRPWWGHEDHLHVRVACPEDSPSCVPGKEIPVGNGCDATLDWWFGEEARAKGEEPAARTAPLLPAACSAVAEGTP